MSALMGDIMVGEKGDRSKARLARLPFDAAIGKQTPDDMMDMRPRCLAGCLLACHALHLCTDALAQPVAVLT